jgi:hypothetical protein
MDRITRIIDGFRAYFGCSPDTAAICRPITRVIDRLERKAQADRAVAEALRESAHKARRKAFTHEQAADDADKRASRIATMFID